MQIWTCPNNCGSNAQSVGVHGAPEHTCTAADGAMVAYDLAEGELLPIAKPNNAAVATVRTADVSGQDA